MENTDNNYNENIQKCPYHAHLNAAVQNAMADKDANTGDWDDEREERKTEEGYNNDENDNSGGAGSSGSASTNS
ncbi:MAG: hypothetical protein EOO44_06700 [Flavobacterium sp.]|nr:MAG: hypothetical protein EOO44_06700 [Flavobacterium sp.]